MYPNKTIATTKKGKREIRILKETGKAIVYGYRDEETENEIDGKYTIAIKTEKGIKKWMIISLKNGKELVVSKTTVDSLAVWDPKEKKVFRL